MIPQATEGIAEYPKPPSKEKGNNRVYSFISVHPFILPKMQGPFNSFSLVKIQSYIYNIYPVGWAPTEIDVMCCSFK